jgi:D-alanyl-D-alanine carboxypeptidase
MLTFITQVLMASMMLQSVVTAQPASLLSQTQLPQAQPRVWSQPPQFQPTTEPFDISIGATSALVVDQASGHVVYEKNRDEVRSIASLTKLMTALVFIDFNIDWNQHITILSSDYRAGASADLFIGESYSVRDVFSAMLVGSSNEAAVALARVTGLTSDGFIEKMNDKAKNLGMVHTKFSDVSGLDANNISTASDLAILASIAFSQVDVYEAARQPRYQLQPLEGRVRWVYSTNQILNQSFGSALDEYVVEVGKTGYVERSGYCFISQSRDSNGNRLITIILNSPKIEQRFVDAKSLIYWVFSHYIWSDVK